MADKETRHEAHYYLKYNLLTEGCGDGAGRLVQDWFLSPVTTDLCIVWGRCSYSNNFSPLCSSSPTALQHLSSQLDYILRSGPKYISSTYCWAPTSSETVRLSFFPLFPHPSSPFAPTVPPLTFYGSVLTAGRNGHIVWITVLELLKINISMISVGRQIENVYFFFLSIKKPFTHFSSEWDLQKGIEVEIF